MGHVWAAVRAWGRRAAMVGFVALFLLCTSMLASCMVVHHLTGGRNPVSTPGPEALLRARLLRTYGNELVELCNRYSARVPDGGTGITPANRRWIDWGFRADLQFLDYRMNDTIPGAPEALTRLKAAVTRCAVMARNPDDRALRGRVLEEVRLAVAYSEQYIDALLNGLTIGPPPEPMHFEPTG